MPARRRRRPYGRALAGVRLALLGVLVVAAAVAVRDVSRFELPLAGLVHDLGPDATSVVWWDTRQATTASIVVGLVLWLAVSLLAGRRQPAARVRPAGQAAAAPPRGGGVSARPGSGSRPGGFEGGRRAGGGGAPTRLGDGCGWAHHRRRFRPVRGRFPGPGPGRCWPGPVTLADTAVAGLGLQMWQAPR